MAKGQKPELFISVKKKSKQEEGPETVRLPFDKKGLNSDLNQKSPGLN
jgi:hypothetical protein